MSVIQRGFGSSPLFTIDHVHKEPTKMAFIKLQAFSRLFTANIEIMQNSSQSNAKEDTAADKLVIDPTPSNLGTQQYWDEMYEVEVRNFDQFGDTGEIWFGEDVQERVLMHIEEELEGLLNNETSRVLDLGCGNGMFLVQMAKHLGYQKLKGIDYSTSSIDLARKIASSEGLEYIEYLTVDFLDEKALQQSGLKEEKFHLIHDKGTFDAICLNENKEKRSIYKEIVKNLLQTNEPAFFVITSCNWTQDELIKHFNPCFDLHSTIQYPSFEFGGTKGSTVVTCIFQHKNANF